jgi:non-ribosomal peptide synthetase component E (peptide arylation enzyme)
VRATHPPSSEAASFYRSAGHWRDRTLDEYFAWVVREHGDAIGLVVGSRRLTFAELDEQVARAAAFLVERGIKPGDVVSFQLPNVVAAFVTFHATQRIGAVSNPIVPVYRGHELRHILAQARSKVAVIPATFRGFDFADLYRRLRADLPDLGHVVLVGEAEPQPGETRWDDLITLPVDSMPARCNHPDEIALLLYTSGTTAAPKGVLHSHNTMAFEAHLVADWGRLDERDVFLGVSPVTHVTGILNSLLLPIFSGSRLVLQDIWDPDVALDHIERERVTYLMIATPFLRGLVQAAAARQADTSSLRRIGCGGADIPISLMREAVANFCPGTVRVYGASEGATVTSSTEWDPPEKRVTTEGRWLPSYEGVIVDEHGVEVGPGVSGELQWSGAGMFLGFLDPALNEGAFTPEGRYRSGDIATLDADGYLTITGRLKDVINRAGEKFSAYEVEQLLAEHPAIREVAVVAQPDPVTGERACAWLGLHDGNTSLTINDLAEFLIARDVAKLKIPEDVAILDALPRTAAGKVQKSVLRDRARERVSSTGMTT